MSVPVSAAYNQWTQFEEFPSFMEGVEQIVQTDETRTGGPPGFQAQMRGT